MPIICIPHKRGLYLPTIAHSHLEFALPCDDSVRDTHVPNTYLFVQASESV